MVAQFRVLDRDRVRIPIHARRLVLLLLRGYNRRGLAAEDGMSGIAGSIQSG